MIKKADTSSDDRLKVMKKISTGSPGPHSSTEHKTTPSIVHKHDSEERERCRHGVTAFSQQEVDGQSRQW